MKSIIKNLKAYNAPSDTYLKGRNHLLVIGDNTLEHNALELKQTIDLAKQILPNRVARSATNQMNIMVAPGNYSFGATKLVLDTPYINLVSLTGNCDVLIDGISITGNNIFVRGIDTGTNAFSITGTGVTAEKCKGLNYVSDAPAAESTTGWAGVRFNPNIPDTELTRVGDADWAQIFTDIELVTLADDGTVNNVLATFANPTIVGATDGTDGQVMVRIPKKYYREVFTEDGTLCGLDMSNEPRSGFKLHEKFSYGAGRNEIFVGAYESHIETVMDGETEILKMQSIADVTVDGEKTITEFRAIAAARGEGWHAYDFYTQHLIQMMFYLYYTDFNSQKVLPGYTDNTWNVENPYRNAGRTNILKTVNGSVPADEMLDADIYTEDNWFTTNHSIANRFLFIENLFGHRYKFIDGQTFRCADGVSPIAYITANPALFSSVDVDVYANYESKETGLSFNQDKYYGKNFGGLLLPKSFEDDSDKYSCDYYYLSPADGDFFRVVFAGGCLADGGDAGVACRIAPYDLGNAITYCVSRLCFEN